MNPELLRRMDEQERLFCDNMLVQHNKETFLVGMISGGTGETYIVTPAHAKGILNAFAQHVADYEKQFGTIDLTPAPLQSPLQMKDLKNPGQN